MQFPIYIVKEQDFDDFEDMGTKSKFWYTESDCGQQFLFKSIHTEDKQGTPIVRDGEDWAEKIACELAELLQIPHAKYDLALHNGERGIRSLNFSVKGDTLTFGNTLLEKIFDSQSLLQIAGTQKTQEIPRVYVVLSRVIINPPRGWNETQNIKSAYDVFLGYVMLDCLISNQDRHNQNWAMVTDSKGMTYLAPSFDHAASLGRNESDEKRAIRLNTKDKNQTVQKYVERCKSHFYFKGEQQKSIEAFEKFSILASDAAIEWIERLEAINSTHVDSILSSIPDNIMSAVSKKFCAAIIESNRKRIIETKDYLLSLRETN